MERVLIIDDDEELCELVTEYLTKQGFHVDAVHEGTQGVTQALSGQYTLVTLDVMLPGIDGFEVLRRIRMAEGSSPYIPVLMLTARGEEIDRIVGLEIGADDYLPKPFSPRELVARIRAILRRAQSNQQPAPSPATASTQSRLRLGDVEVDTGGRIVWLGQTPVELTAVEFDLLVILLNAAGQVVTRQELVQSVLARKLTPFDRSIDTHVSNLRRKLGHQIHTDTGPAERIKTVRGIGYIYARPAETGARPAMGAVGR